MVEPPRTARPVLLPLATIVVAAGLGISARPATAQIVVEPESNGVRLGEAQTQRYQVGLTIKAASGPLQGIFATIPVPREWPEQQVRVVDEQVSVSGVKLSRRVINDSVEQMLVRIPRLAAGKEARVLRTYEVTRRAILPPRDPSLYVIPEKVDRDMRVYLGDSPYIETSHRAIRAMAKEAVGGREGDWERVEAIYDHVRSKVTYRFDPKIKGAAQALRDGVGDCEELSSLFIALCRANDIPARAVWVPDHCYAEFYLLDDEGNGHWFPCQPAGSRAFGEMPEMRPILQKGDNFRVPEKGRASQRYVAEFLKVAAVRGSGPPKYSFVREFVDE